MSVPVKRTQTRTAQIVNLLETTVRGYRDIAAEVGCSHQNVFRIAAKLSLNTPERRAASFRRFHNTKRLQPGKYPDIICPKCGSNFIGRWEKHGNRYGTPRYKCRACGSKFLKEYKWVSSGDHARHLATICRASGYSRPDVSIRLTRYWQRYRSIQFWPYAESLDDAPLLKVINDAVPRSLPEHIRADICQDAVLAVLEGKLNPEKIQLRPLLKKWFQENTTGFQPFSLDSPSLSHDGKTLGEVMGYS